MTLRNVSRVFVALVLVVGLPMQLGATTSTPEAGLRAADLAAAPSKVCHPKKPITCRADVLASTSEETSEISVIAQPEVKQAMICVGPRWLCRTDALESSALPLSTDSTPVEVSAQPQPESQQAMICVGPRWLCRADSVL